MLAERKCVDAYAAQQQVIAGNLRNPGETFLEVNAKVIGPTGKFGVKEAAIAKTRFGGKGYAGENE